MQPLSLPGVSRKRTGNAHAVATTRR